MKETSKTTAGLPKLSSNKIWMMSLGFLGVQTVAIPDSGNGGCGYRDVTIAKLRFVRIWLRFHGRLGFWRSYGGFS